MILLDTSVLIEAFSGPRRLAETVVAATQGGERLSLCSPVLYEWRRGARTEAELASQELVFPAEMAWPFAAMEAIVAGDLYRRLPRGRRRELDFAIAACALTRSARLWTLNPEDFTDIPELTLFVPERA